MVYIKSETNLSVVSCNLQGPFFLPPTQRIRDMQYRTKASRQRVTLHLGLGISFLQFLSIVKKNWSQQIVSVSVCVTHT